MVTKSINASHTHTQYIDININIFHVCIMYVGASARTNSEFLISLIKRIIYLFIPTLKREKGLNHI